MAKHTHTMDRMTMNILDDVTPSRDDRNVGVGPMLKEHSMKEDRIHKLRR